MKKFKYTHPTRSTVTGIVTEKKYLDMLDDIALRGLVWAELIEPEKVEAPKVNAPKKPKRNLKQKKASGL